MSRAVCARWQAGQVDKPLTTGTMHRVSYVFRIYGALHVQLQLPAQPARANAWVRSPNDAPLFAGSTALQVMLGGKLSDVADYLEFYTEGGDYS